MTDTELLDALQSLNDRSDYTGKCILRMSTTGRGWRLHETSDEDFGPPRKCVREAIVDFLGIKDTPND